MTAEERAALLKRHVDRYRAPLLALDGQSDETTELIRSIRLENPLELWLAFSPRWQRAGKADSGHAYLDGWSESEIFHEAVLWALVSYLYSDESESASSNLA